MIKVITGVRRCGKSCLMHTISEELIEQGVSENSIIFIDLKKHGYKSINTPEMLEAVINKECTSEGKKYLFIDEIQNVRGFESVIEAYRLEETHSISPSSDLSVLFFSLSLQFLANHEIH